MFKKKKKTYIDKINFDVFTDDNNEFDLFDYDNEDNEIETDTENENPENNENISDEEAEEEPETGYEEATEEEPEAELDEEAEEEPEAETKEEAEEETETDLEEESEEDTEDEIEDESEDRHNLRNNKKNKSKKKIAFWIILWILLFSAGVCAFLYFKTDLLDGLFEKKDKTPSSTTEIATADEPVVDESFKTIYSYETNANIDINALMADYYDALVRGDKDKLKDIVTEPDAFGDMVLYETKSQVISEYSNITCYTIPGLNENEILVFTTSNLNITGVTSKPLDIQRFYVVDTGNGYKINNGVLSQETIDYINLQTGSPDVQALYKSVQDNINQCLSEDTTFADFMNKISTNTDAY